MFKEFNDLKRPCLKSLNRIFGVIRGQSKPPMGRGMIFVGRTLRYWDVNRLRAYSVEKLRNLKYEIFRLKRVI